MPISRRKKFNYKENKVVKPPKTSRTERSPETRAFLCGAITAMRGGYASLGDLAAKVHRNQSELSKLYKQVTEKAESLSVDLWDEILYQNDLGRGRCKLLTQEQKYQIVTLVTSSRDNREQEPYQAITHDVFNHIVTQMSIRTFENVMYEARYARRRPGWKPKLTREQEKERYK
jgi:hypothetical protein